MPTNPGRTMIEVDPADRARLQALARRLSDIGPGKFSQARALRYLLDTRDAMELIVYAKSGDDPE